MTSAKHQRKRRSVEGSSWAVKALAGRVRLIVSALIFKPTKEHHETLKGLILAASNFEQIDLVRPCARTPVRLRRYGL